MRALKIVAACAAFGFLINIASADILYFDVSGLVTVNGQPAEGVTVEVIPCVGARLPSDWPSNGLNTVSIVPDPASGFNYSIIFETLFAGAPYLPGPEGSATYLSPLNGAWFTPIDVELKFSYQSCPPVIVSCADVRTAIDATVGTDHLGVPHISVDIPCLPQLVPGDTAGTGFWKNKNGQALIKSLNGGGTSTALGDWLASNFPYLFGANAGARNLTGKSNLAVASLFAKLVNTSGSKPDAQVMATALSAYVTDSDLAGNIAARYGFNVSPGGTGAKSYNVGLLGSAIGVANNSELSVLELLLQANAQRQAGTYNTRAFGGVFEAINESGDSDSLD